MTYKSKPAWCVYAAIVVATASLYLHVGTWIAAPVLLILALCAYPQSYAFGGSELVIHDALTRRRIPYHTIVSARADGAAVRIRYGLGSEIEITPTTPQAFLDALVPRIPTARYVEYRFVKPTGAFTLN